MRQIDVQQRQKIAEELFLQGYGCAQAVLLAFADVCSLEEETLARIGSALGGGIGRLREVCGAVNAMAIVAGFISPAADPSDMAARTRNYALVQKLSARFREEKGSIVCREILGIRATQKESPRPSERTPEYYKSRPCTANVGLAARILAETLIEEE